MPKRPPAGFVVPLHFWSGAEVRSLPGRVRAGAVGVFVLAGNYAASELTDGYVDKLTLSQLGCTPAIRAALASTANSRGESSPLWDAHDDGSVTIRNWGKWQRTRADVEAWREAESGRKRGSREGLVDKNENLTPAVYQRYTATHTIFSGETQDGIPFDVPPTSSSVNESSVADSERIPQRIPDRQRQRKEKDVNSPPVVVQLGAAQPPWPCARHRGGDAGDACWGCKRARDHLAKQADDQQQAATQTAKQQRLTDWQTKARQIEKCKLCDQDGYRNGITCDHVDRTEIHQRGLHLVKTALQNPKKFDESEK